MDMIKDVYADVIIPPDVSSNKVPAVIDPAYRPNTIPIRSDSSEMFLILILLSIFMLVSIVIGILLLKKVKK